MNGAYWYGALLVGAGVLLARAVAVRDQERILGRLGPLSEEGSPPRPVTGVGRRLSDRAARRGWPGTPSSYALVTVGAAAAGAALGARLAGPVGALVGVVGGPLGVEALLSRRLALAAQAADAHLRETVIALASGVRAGLSIRRALVEAARDAEAPLGAALEASLHRMDTGEPPERAVESLAGTVRPSDARLLATVLRLHRRSGGDLPVLLDEVAGIIGQRVESRRQVRALTAQGRASGVVLAALPVAFVALLSGTGGDDLGAFYRTPTGAALLLAGLLCEALGFAWIRRIVRPREPA